jgi:hypothetical protein
VSGRAVAQSVRRCITHLLPVRPTCVGRTNLTSQGAPRSVTTGEPDDRQRVCQTDQLPTTPRVSTPGVGHFYAPFRGFSRLFAPFGGPSRPLHCPRENGQKRPQKPPFPRRAARFGPKTLLPSTSAGRQRVIGHRSLQASRSGTPQNAPPLGLGGDKTCLRPPCQKMHPSQRQNQTPLVRFSLTLSPLLAEQDSIDRRDTKTINIKDYVPAPTVSQGFSLIRFAARNMP